MRFLMVNKIKKIYLRKGDHPFVLQTLFIYKATQQNWSTEEINKVIQKTLYKNKMDVYAILMNHIEVKK